MTTHEELKKKIDYIVLKPAEWDEVEYLAARRDLLALINQARKEAVIEELESIPVVASFDRVYMHILGRLEALKEGK